MKALGIAIAVLSLCVLGFGLFMIMSLNRDQRSAEFGEERHFTATHLIIPGVIGAVIGFSILGSALSKEQRESQKKEEAAKAKDLEGFRRV